MKHWLLLSRFVFALLALHALGLSSLDEWCNIPIIPLSQLDIGGGNHNTLPEYPLIYRGDTQRQSVLSTEGALPALYRNHGDAIAELSSSNTYSHGRKSMKLSQYLDTLKPIEGNASVAANETYYLFGHNYAGIWNDLSSMYVLPPCRFCDEAGAVTLGIGGKRSGVSFHFHGPGFSEVIVGGKWWFLFPSHLTKVVEKFGANTTMSAWFDQIFPKLLDANQNTNTESQLNGDVKMSSTLEVADIPVGFTVQEWHDLSSNLYACKIDPKDILYFPPQWMHATLNTDEYNLFVSLFIDPQLIREK